VATPTLIRSLSTDEQAELAGHVQAVYRAMFAFGLTAGEHLYHIHSKRLYRSYGSFDELFGRHSTSMRSVPINLSGPTNAFAFCRMLASIACQPTNHSAARFIA
jgi:hypothetical protein